MTFLGIDGGGSKTTFLLENERGTRTRAIRDRPLQLAVLGLRQRSRISDPWNSATCPPFPTSCVVGLPAPVALKALSSTAVALSALLPQAQVFVETDAFITYMGAIGLRPGILLIAGTGSIALARQSGGTMIRAGGWGPVFGDEGGGFWIGREAIRCALRAKDAGEAAEFVSAIEKALGLSRITDAPGAWKDGSIDVRSVAALASEVISRYPAEPARGIVIKPLHTSEASAMSQVAGRFAGSVPEGRYPAHSGTRPS